MVALRKINYREAPKTVSGFEISDWRLLEIIIFLWTLLGRETFSRELIRVYAEENGFWGIGSGPSTFLGRTNWSSLGLTAYPHSATPRP